LIITEVFQAIQKIKRGTLLVQYASSLKVGWGI